MSETISVEYFREQIIEFRQMMEDKTCWEFSDIAEKRKIDLAFEGLFHIYLRTGKKTEDDKMHFDAIVDEFKRRKFYMEMRKEASDE